LSARAYEDLLAERARELIVKPFIELVKRRAMELLSPEERRLAARIFRRVANFEEELSLSPKEAAAARKLLFDPEVEEAIDEFDKLWGMPSFRKLQAAIRRTLAETEAEEGSCRAGWLG